MAVWRANGRRGPTAPTLTHHQPLDATPPLTPRQTDPASHGQMNRGVDTDQLIGRLDEADR